MLQNAGMQKQPRTSPSQRVHTLCSRQRSWRVCYRLTTLHECCSKTRLRCITLQCHFLIEVVVPQYWCARYSCLQCIKSGLLRVVPLEFCLLRELTLRSTLAKPSSCQTNEEGILPGIVSCPATVELKARR